MSTAAATSKSAPSSSLSPPLSIEAQIITLGQAALPSSALPHDGDLTQRCGSEPAVAQSTAALSQNLNSETAIPSDLPPTENVGRVDASKPLNELDIDFIRIDKTCKFPNHISRIKQLY